MIVENIKVTHNRIAWTAESVDTVPHIFINGELQSIFKLFNTLDRSIAYQNNAPFMVEIHEVNQGEYPEANTIKLKSKPVFVWGKVDDAEKYRLYHKPPIGDEAVILTYEQSILPRNSYKMPTGLESGTHHFRVESVDKYGNESNRALWTHYIPPFPEAPLNLIISNGSSSGLFDFTIT